MHVFLNPNPRVDFLRPEGTGFAWRVTAQVGNVLGANGMVNYSWKLGNEVLPAESGALLDHVFIGQPGTRNLQVTATDAQGTQSLDVRPVVFNHPALNEPGELYPALDPVKGKVVDSSGNDFAFDANRVANGLIVLTHGVRSNPNKVWIRSLANAIESRLGDEGKPLPNIVIYGWEEGARPSGRYEERADDEGMLARELQMSRLAMKSLFLLYPGFAEFMFDIVTIRPAGLEHGLDFANWVTSEIAAGHIAPNAKIHFIGHSAGGFVVGEAGQVLSSRGVNVTQVTMLDTPLPVRSHFAGTPQPATVERYVSSWFGAIAPTVDVTFVEGLYYHYRALSSRSPLAGRFVPTVAAHQYSYDWYLETARDRTNEEQDGFYYSPFMGNYWPAAVAAGGVTPRAPRDTQTTQPVTEFDSFGVVQQIGSQFVISEAGNSGLTKTMTLPVGAVALRMQFQFTVPGDGDFLSVAFGDAPPLYTAPDLPVVRTDPLTVDIPIGAWAGQTGALVIKLVSRGAANAQLTAGPVSLVLSNDPDMDTLTTTDEQARGTDPLLADTDGDGLTDSEEVNTHLTDPLAADSDADGMNDAAELAAGTNPLLNGSVLRITNVTRTPAGGITMQWSAANGKTYRVIRSDALDQLNYELIASGVAGTDGAGSFTDASPALEARRFYWVEIE